MAWFSKGLKETERLAESVGFADSLRQRQFWSRRGRAEASLFLYRGSTRIDLSGGERSWWRGIEDIPPHFNLVQTAVDYLTSLLVRNRVRPMFVTEKGSAEVKRKAEIGQRSTEGTMQSLGLYDELGMLRTRDGLIFDGGGVKYAADHENTRVIASRVRSWEVFAPEREARLGKPRQWVHAQSIDKLELASQFPKDSAEHGAVMAAESEPLDIREQTRDDKSDLILARELWHLPSGRVDLDKPASFGLNSKHEPDDSVDPGHDGWRVLAVKNHILFSEPWPYDYIPISWFLPCREPVGPWSRGIPETLAGAQVALLEYADMKQRYLRRHAVPHLIVWDKAKLNPLEMSNDHAKIWTSKTPPTQAAQYLQTNAVPGELLREEETITRNAEKQIRVSEMSLSGVKPPGMEHAPGMEFLSELEQVSLTDMFHAYERAALQDARIISGCHHEMGMYNDKMELVFGEDKELARYKWSDFNLKRSEFQIKIFPTNYFAVTPTARWRQIKEMAQAGAFDPTPKARMMARALGTAPDFDELIGDQTARIENVERCVSDAVAGKPDEDWIPQPYMDLDYAILHADDTINRMEADHEDGEAIDRVIQFRELAKEMRDKLQPPPPPPPPAEPPPPGAPPGMPLQ